jgi:hypothetical protein
VSAKDLYDPLRSPKLHRHKPRLSATSLADLLSMVDRPLFNLIDLRQKWTYQNRIISVKIKVNLTQSAKKKCFYEKNAPNNQPKCRQEHRCNEVSQSSYAAACCVEVTTGND